MILTRLECLFKGHDFKIVRKDFYCFDVTQVPSVKNPYPVKTCEQKSADVVRTLKKCKRCGLTVCEDDKNWD